MTDEDEWVTVNIPRQVHEKIKRRSEKTGKKIKVIYSQVLELGWAMYAGEERIEGEVNSEITSSEEDEGWKEEIDESGKIEPAEKLDLILEKLENHEDDIADLKGKIEGEKTEVKMNDELSLDKRIDVEEKDEHEVPVKFHDFLEKMTRDDVGEKVGSLEKIRSITLTALRWLIDEERGTHTDITEATNISDNEWSNYASHGLAYLAEKTEDDNEDVVVNPGPRGTWWWYIEDVDKIEYPYTDIDELPDDVLEVAGEVDTTKYESHCYIGRGHPYDLVEESMRVVRYIQEAGRTKKSEIIDNVYVPYINQKEESWWKSVHGALKHVETRTERITLGKTITWVEDERGDDG